eukprot:15449917-Alexandrium_andersonii.AAC.1
MDVHTSASRCRVCLRPLPRPPRVAATYGRAHRAVVVRTACLSMHSAYECSYRRVSMQWLAVRRRSKSALNAH